MVELIPGLIIWLGILICVVLSKYLDRITRILAALRIETDGWECGPSGVKFQKTDDGGVETVGVDGYRYFKSYKKFMKYLTKRSDRF